MATAAGAAFTPAPRNVRDGVVRHDGVGPVGGPGHDVALPVVGQGGRIGRLGHPGTFAEVGGGRARRGWSTGPPGTPEVSVPPLCVCVQGFRMGGSPGMVHSPGFPVSHGPIGV